MQKFTRLMIVVAMLVMAISLTQAQDDNFVHVSLATSDIPSIDPSIGTDTHSIQYTSSLMPGLTIIDEVTSETKPGMATWTVSDDGLTYTFSITPDVPWVKYNAETGAVEEVMVDGAVRYVTAEDFIYGMTRSMDPRTGSYYGGILASWVEGGSAFNGATADAADDASDEDLAAMVEPMMEGLALTAVDDYTLEVVAPQPAGFLSQLLGMWMSTAQPGWLVDEFGDAWAEPENVISYGPFALQEWLRGESATMVKNPFWPGTEGIPVAQIDGVVDTFLDPNAALVNYEAGTLDSVGVPGAELDRVLADATLNAEYSTSPGTCTFYLAMNTTKAPTDDIRVRQAIAQSLNRQLLIDGVLGGVGEPAYFFARPELAGAATIDSHPEVALQEDAEAAAAKLEEYVSEGNELPVLSYGTTTSESSALIAAALAEMWSDALEGFEMEIQQQEWAVFLETTDVEETAPNIWRLGWCLDYPDAHNFLFDVFHSSVIDNGTGFRSEEFDSLLEEAQAMTDNAARAELYARAEEILTNEVAALIPYQYNQSSRLVKPYIDRPLGASVTQFELWTINN
ncbi:MAG: peptide ABC transporter substrate-binding protein [Aggregatilineales bacterium]